MVHIDHPEKMLMAEKINFNILLKHETKMFFYRFFRVDSVNKLILCTIFMGIEVLELKKKKCRH